MIPEMLLVEDHPAMSDIVADYLRLDVVRRADEASAASRVT